MSGIRGEMGCEEARERILAGGGGEDLAAHLPACEGCAALAADGGVLALGLGDVYDASKEGVAEAFPGLEGALQGEGGIRGRLRALPTWARRLCLGLVAAVLLLVVGGAMLRPDWVDYPSARILLALGPLTGAGAVAIWNALRPLHVPPLRGAALAVVVGLGVLLPFAAVFLPAGPDVHQGSAAACFGFGTVLGLPVLLGALVFDRAPTVLRSPLLAAAAAAGLVGTLSLELHCPVNDQTHLMMGHATVAAALVVVVVGASILYRRAGR